VHKNRARTFFVRRQNTFSAQLDTTDTNRYLDAMIDAKLFDDISQRIAGNLPAGLQLMQDDLKKNIRSAIEASLSHLNLVTREEFDAQTRVLARTRAKLEALEKQVAELEQQR
jgi:BMFP domain-containing protein YqiC